MFNSFVFLEQIGNVINRELFAGSKSEAGKGSMIHILIHNCQSGHLFYSLLSALVKFGRLTLVCQSLFLRFWNKAIHCLPFRMLRYGNGFDLPN